MEITRVPSMFGRSAAKPKLCVPGGLVIGPLYDGVYWPGKVRPKKICASGKSPGKNALSGLMSEAALVAAGVCEPRIHARLSDSADSKIFLRTPP